MANKVQTLQNMSTRQKITAGIIVLVVIIIIWQLIGLFGSKTAEPTALSMNTPTTPTMKASPMNATPTASITSGGVSTVSSGIPQPGQLIQTSSTTTQREAEMMKLQEETQAKYIAALNELQMLKVARDIAEANQAIMTAKLATVDSGKKIIDMLSPIAGGIGTPEGYAKNLVNPTSTVPSGGSSPKTTVPSLDVTYSVISVSQLRYKWSAVLGYKGNLYNVNVGDILPPDHSKVVSINKSGVILEKDGIRSKISLVPII